MTGKIIYMETMRVEDEELTGVFVEIPLDDMKNAKMMYYKTVSLTGAEDNVATYYPSERPKTT